MRNTEDYGMHHYVRFLQIGPLLENVLKFWVLAITEYVTPIRVHNNRVGGEYLTSHITPTLC